MCPHAIIIKKQPFLSTEKINHSLSEYFVNLKIKKFREFAINLIFLPDFR